MKFLFQIRIWNRIVLLTHDRSKKGHLVLPSTNTDVVKNFPKASGQILSLLNPKENDVVIITSSNNPRKAEYGAIAAAWTLLDEEEEE